MLDVVFVCWEVFVCVFSCLLGGLFSWEVFLLGGFFAGRFFSWEVFLLRGFLVGRFFVWLGSIHNSNSRCHRNSNIVLMVLVVVLVHVILIVISRKSDSSIESAERSQSLLNLKEAGKFHFPRYKYAVTAAW